MHGPDHRFAESEQAGDIGGAEKTGDPMQMNHVGLQNGGMGGEIGARQGDGKMSVPLADAVVINQFLLQQRPACSGGRFRCGHLEHVVVSRFFSSHQKARLGAGGEEGAMQSSGRTGGTAFAFGGGDNNYAHRGHQKGIRLSCRVFRRG